MDNRYKDNIRMKSLQEIWNDLNAKGFGSDKGSVHSYLPIYEKLFEPYRETAKNVLEIGCFKGDSIRLWTEYFINAEIFGIDCDIKPHGGMADLEPLIKEANPRQHIHIMDAEDEKEIRKRFGKMKFDVIIDDANHSIEQQLTLCSIWKPFLVKGGIYVIEDIQSWLDADEITKFTGGEIIDLRHVKSRYDDVMIIIKNK